MIKPDLYADGSCIKVRFFVETNAEGDSHLTLFKPG
jgi:hypothetical protein